MPWLVNTPPAWSRPRWRAGAREGVVEAPPLLRSARETVPCAEDAHAHARLEPRDRAADSGLREPERFARADEAACFDDCAIFSRFPGELRRRRRAVEVLGAALEGTTRPLIVTSALGALPNGSLLTEDMSPVPGPHTLARRPRSAPRPFERAGTGVAGAPAALRTARVPARREDPDRRGRARGHLGVPRRRPESLPRADDYAGRRRPRSFM